MRSVVLLGAPGSGKGTLATILKNSWNVPHISTGDMFREAVRANSPMGLKAFEYMKAGLLVPDDITIGVVDERFSKSDVKKGFILDGFPRTIKQAEALDEILTKNNIKLNSVILLDIDEKLIIKRITGRRTCPKCGAIYHIENVPPRKQNICDKCSSDLIQRKDDTEEVVKERLNAYNKQTSPLVDFYRNKKILVRIDASKTPDKMIEQVEALSL
ncbi:MAG: adenylate kinase [Proteobacteria bacterium]|nr:adenylate kinase [Pseudomonadota bacterium]